MELYSINSTDADAEVVKEDAAATVAATPDAGFDDGGLTEPDATAADGDGLMPEAAPAPVAARPSAPVAPSRPVAPAAKPVTTAPVRRPVTATSAPAAKPVTAPARKVGAGNPQ